MATVRLPPAKRKRGKVWPAKRNYCPKCFVKKAKKVNENISVFEVRNKEDFKAVLPQQRRTEKLDVSVCKNNGGVLGWASCDTITNSAHFEVFRDEKRRAKRSKKENVYCRNLNSNELSQSVDIAVFLIVTIPFSSTLR